MDDNLRKMIDKSTYNKIAKKWKGHIYSTEARVLPRLKVMQPYFKYLKDKDVLEFGCNAGMFAYEIAKQAKSYVGVDKKDYAYEQAEITRKYIKNPNVTFLNMRAREFITDYMNAFDFNAFVSFYTLYHLHNDEVEMLRNKIFPKCQIVINMVRNRERKRKDNNHGEYWKIEKVVELMKDFKITKYQHGEKYSIVVGIRC